MPDKPICDDERPSVEDQRLKSLKEAAELYRAATTDYDRRFFEGRLLGLSEGMDEHPGFITEWDLPCLCDECLSYGD